MSQVQQFGGNTTAVSTGSSTYVWNDKDNSGTVNTGDVIVRTHQGDASVFSYVVGKGEGMYTWGDPHADNVAFSAAGEKSFIDSASALFGDAKDGVLNNVGLVGAMEANLRQNGARTNIGDFHADVTLAMGDGTRIEHDVASIQGNANIKVTDHIDVNLLDSKGAQMTLTLREVWSGNGGGGQMSIAETTGNTAAQAIADANALPVLHEFRGANLRIETGIFGEIAGTKKYAHIVKSDGQIDWGHGKVTMDGIRAYDAERKGDMTAILGYAFQLNGEDDDDKPAAAPARTAAATLAAGK
jgi:hypothetical protein